MAPRERKDSGNERETAAREMGRTPIGRVAREEQVPVLPTGQAREGEKCVHCVWRWKAVFYLDESNFGRMAGVWGGGVYPTEEVKSGGKVRRGGKKGAGV